MPINDTTTNRGYQKPNIANTLSDDVGRLRSALDSIDTDMAAKAPTAGPTFTGVTTVAAGSAGAPSLTFTGATSDTGIYSPGADQLAISTGGTGRVFVDAAGKVGIGTSSPGVPLHVQAGAISAPTWTASDVVIAGNATGNPAYYQALSDTAGGLVFSTPTTRARSFLLWSEGNGNMSLTNGSSGSIIFTNNGSERARIDSSGGLLVGTSSARANAFAGGVAPQVQMEGTNGPTSSLLLASNRNDIGQAFLVFGKSRSTSVGGNTSVASGDILGTITFQGADGTNLIEGARIESYVDGTPGTNSMPGRIVLSTTASGASSPTERLRIDSAGTTTFTSAASTAPAIFKVNTTEVGRWDSSGRLLVGTSSDSGGALLQVNGDRIRVGTAKTPASATATGTTGEICWDASYVYICTATNTWKRAALSTW